MSTENCDPDLPNIASGFENSCSKEQGSYVILWGFHALEWHQNSYFGVKSGNALFKLDL